MTAADGPRVSMLVRNPFTHDSRVEKEAATLAAAGYRVTVVAEARPDLPLREERESYAVLRVERPATRVRGLRLVAHLRRMEEVLLGTQPDILHAHDSDALQPVARAARRLGIPFVYDAHELWLGKKNRGRSRLYFALYRAYYALIERRYLHRAVAWIVVTPPLAPYLERRYGLSDVRLVANYPDRSRPDAVRDLRTLPGGDRIRAGVPIVLYLGGMMAGRGLEQLIEAMVDVPQADLVMLGSGEYGAVLVRHAERFAVGDRLHLLPAVPTDQVIDYSASADIGVSPIVDSCLSYRYALPNKLFQYMAARLPVVASDFSQIRDVIDASGAGITVDTSRPAAIATALNRILADPAEAARMGARGQAAVESRYNWEVSAAELRRVYAGLPARRR